MIDALSIRKQTLWDNQQDKYVGFVNHGNIPTPKPDTLSSEAVVFVLDGARSQWKCPIGYFLADKMIATIQLARLVYNNKWKNSEHGHVQRAWMQFHTTI